MLIERKALDSQPHDRRPAHCLDCPDCQGMCLEAAAMRLIPETVLQQGQQPREVRV